MLEHLLLLILFLLVLLDGCCVAASALINKILLLLCLMLIMNSIWLITLIDLVIICWIINVFGRIYINVIVNWTDRKIIDNVSVSFLIMKYHLMKHSLINISVYHELNGGNLFILLLLASSLWKASFFCIIISFFILRSLRVKTEFRSIILALLGLLLRIMSLIEYILDIADVIIIIRVELTSNVRWCWASSMIRVTSWLWELSEI